jgi:hypothetical protein
MTVSSENTGAIFVSAWSDVSDGGHVSREMGRSIGAIKCCNQAITLIENCRAPAFRASGLDTRKQRSVSVMAIFHQPVTSSARNVALRVADARRRARQLATENVGGQRKENKNDVARIERPAKKSHNG